MLVVLDANVLVSALLSPFGAPARVLDLILVGDVQLAYSDQLLTEYREVLARPKFGFEPRYVTYLLDYLTASGRHVVPRPLAVSLPDADDLPFLEAAAETGAVLITGNRRHFPADACGRVEVVTPAEFLAQRGWRAQGG